MACRNTLIGACVFAVTAMVVTASNATTIRSPIAFNNASHEKTSRQPKNSAEFEYLRAVEDGDLAGCTINVVEALYGRDGGAWGIFDIEAAVTCSNGGFSYSSSGAWDGNGFHAAGTITDGSGTGDFAGASGRVAQLGGGVTPKDDGSLDVFYGLVIETAE